MRGQINGQVRVAAGGAPVFNVLVSCDTFNGGLVGQTRTDRSGRFRFSDLQADQYNITVRLEGYAEERQTVELLTTPSAYLQFQLRADPSAAPAARPPSAGMVMDGSIPAEAQKEFENGDAALAGQTKEGALEAVRHYEKALSIDPKFVQAELKLGTVYMELGQWDKAEQALRKTIEIDPKSANAFFALGEVYLRQKKYEQAEKSLQEGLAIDANSAVAHVTLARVYWNKVAGVKDEAQWRPPLEKAYAEVKLALALEPNLATAHLLRGNLFFKVNRYQDALLEFEEYLRLDPNGQAATQTRALADRIKKGLAEDKKP
jgi:tetratricopeptide (TPR) repeat protein